MTVFALNRVIQVCNCSDTLPDGSSLSLDLPLNNIIGLELLEIRDNEGQADATSFSTNNACDCP